MAKISVVVPVYNVADYLEECIDSIRRQTLKDLEIILVDDGSTDGSAEICDEAALKDSRIKVIHKENGGALSARKIGADASVSEYIIFADSDDWIDSDFYENLYDEMEKHSVDVVIGGHKNDGWGLNNGEGAVIPSSSHKTGVYRKKDLNAEFYNKLIYGGIGFFEWGIPPSMCDKLFLRKLFLPFLRLTDDRIKDGDDSVCVYPFLLNVSSLAITNYAGYHHRYRENSLCHTFDAAYFERLRILRENFLANVSGTFYENIISPQISRFVFEMALKNASVLYNFPINTKQEHYLFPYEIIPKNSKIILYGAGKVGQDFYRQLKHNNFAEIVLWVDKNSQNLDTNITLPGYIKDCTYDYIIVAVLKEKTAIEIKKYLVNNIHIDADKIIWREYEYLNTYGITIC